MAIKRAPSVRESLVSKYTLKIYGNTFTKLSRSLSGWKLLRGYSSTFNIWLAFCLSGGTLAAAFPLKIPHSRLSANYSAWELNQARSLYALWFDIHTYRIYILLFYFIWTISLHEWIHSGPLLFAMFADTDMYANIMKLIIKALNR